MDIYGAEQNAKKLLKYVQDIAANRPRMYGPTRDRLKHVASVCESIVGTVSAFLEEEILAAEDTEEFERDNSDIQDVLSNIQSSISQLQNFITPQPVVSQTSEGQTSDKLSSQNKKKLVSIYFDMLNKTQCDESKSAQECVDILRLWYRSRFFDSRNAGFRYNVRRIPSWIISIVIAYGKSIHDGNQSSFVYTFTSWCESLKEKDASVPYAVPYDIYQICSNISADDITLQAVILWDILWSNGFNRIDQSEDDSYESAVYQKCVELNPSELDKYRNYQSDSSVIREFHLDYSSSGGEVI